MAPSRSQGHAFGLRDLVVSLFPVLIGLIASVLFWGLIVPLGLLILIPFRTFVLQSALNFRYGKGRFTLADGIDALFGNDETSGLIESRNHKKNLIFYQFFSQDRLQHRTCFSSAKGPLQIFPSCKTVSSSMSLPTGTTRRVKQSLGRGSNPDL